MPPITFFYTVKYQFGTMADVNDGEEVIEAENIVSAALKATDLVRDLMNGHVYSIEQQD